MTEKIDPREVYEDKVDRSQWCACNADKACDVCIDDELYGAVTTTAQAKCEGYWAGCTCAACNMKEQNTRTSVKAWYTKKGAN